MIGADAHPVLDLLHRHGSRIGDRFAEKAGVRRIEMLDQDERDAGLRR